MEELRKLAIKWREIENEFFDCHCHSSCAEELEALLPAVERELTGTDNALAALSREALERGVGMGLAWVWKNTVSLSEDDAEMLKQADPAQIVKDATKEAHASNQ